MKFAPLFIPIHRRIETACVLTWFFLLPAFLISLNIFCLSFWLIVPSLRYEVGLPLLFLYLTYTFWTVAIDDGPKTGGRRLAFARNLLFWKYYRSYYPIQLYPNGKEDTRDEDAQKVNVSLEPGKNYLFGYHPHGIIGIGACGNFATEGNSVSQAFPHHLFHVVTLNLHFAIPIWREVVMSLGFISADRRSIESVVRRTVPKGGKGKGNVVVVVLGGAEEALEAHPDTNDLIVRKRKGFFRLALKTGTSIVPVYAFGENDLFRQVSNDDGTVLKSIQQVVRKWLSFSTPIVIGRGVINYDYGFLPQRRRIATVVGEPLHVEKIENPSPEDIQKLQEKYIDALVTLYDKHKHQLNPNRKRSIQIIA